MGGFSPIPPHYDSLVAKLITYGRDRTEAIRAAEEINVQRRAEAKLVIQGG